MIVKVTESVKTGLWVGDYFINTNSVTRHQAQLLCGQGEVTMAQLVRTMYLLGLGYVLAGQLPLSGLQGAQHGELPSAGVCE